MAVTKTTRKIVSAAALGTLYLIFPKFASGNAKGWFGGTGNWQAPADWNPNGVPDTGDDVVVSTVSTTDVFVSDNDNSLILRALNSLVIDSNGQGEMFLTNAGNTPLDSNSLTLGSGGSANYTITTGRGFFGVGSMNNSSVLTVGNTSTFSCGNFTQNGGTFTSSGTDNFSANYTLNNGTLISSGTCTVSGNFVQHGSVNAASLVVGGTYTLNSGSFTGSASAGTFIDNVGGEFGGDIEIFNHLAFAGSGTFDGNVVNHASYAQPSSQNFAVHESFTQVGGTYAEAGNFGGSFSGTNSLTVGDGATWNHSGGFLQVDNMYVGADGAAGSYNLSGSGSTSVSSMAIGFLGDGSVAQSSGSVVASSVDLGGSRALFLGFGPTSDGPHIGVYTMSGGSLSTGSLIVGDINSLGGIFNLNSGSVTCADLEININSSNTGIFNISGGTFSDGTFATNNGTINQNAGSVDIDTTLNGAGSINVTASGDMRIKRMLQDSLFIGGNGNVFISSLLQLGTIGFQGTPTTNRLRSITFDQTGGTIHGTFNLKNSRLIIDYDTVSPIATIRGDIISGYASGSWNGTGITSSSAHAINVHNTGLGYAEASQILGPSGGTFEGMLVDSTAVLVKYTYYGDSNLDGQVDVSDLGALASNWQKTGNWINGDFNYDGSVNVTDLGLLASNWQAGVGNPLAQESFQQALEEVGLANVFVPEPVHCLAFAGLSYLVLYRKRNRRQ